MINIMLTYAALLINLVIFIRLFTYRREGSRYRPVVSIIAALTMGFAGSSILFMGTGYVAVTPEQWPLLIMLAIVAHGLCRHKGNMARLLDTLAPWDGRDRRK